MTRFHEKVRAWARESAVVVVDFGTQGDLPRWFRRLLLAWLARFDVYPRSDMHSALARLAEGLQTQIAIHPRCRGYSEIGIVGRPLL